MRSSYGNIDSFGFVVNLLFRLKGKLPVGVLVRVRFATCKISL